MPTGARLFLMICASCWHGGRLQAYRIAVRWMAPTRLRARLRSGFEGNGRHPAVPGHLEGQVCAAHDGRAAVERRDAQPRQGRPIEREVGRPPHGGAREERAPNVECDVIDSEGGVQEIALATGTGLAAPSAVAALEAGPLPPGDSEQAVIGTARLDLRDALFTAHAEADDDLAESVRAAAVIVGVALEHEALAR